MNRIGLTVMRCQPFHSGHSTIINKMAEECETAIVCIGSAQKSREKHDPWTIEERMEMLKNVYGAFNNKGEYLGSRIKIIPLADIGAAAPSQWVGYIVEKIKKLGLNEPTDYFTGSEFDAAWFKDHFASDWRTLEKYHTTITTASNPLDVVSYDESGNITYTMRDVYNRYVTEDGIFRRLHIIERKENRIPSATELRGFMELRMDDWMEWVPAVNHELIDNAYPEEYKVPQESTSVLREKPKAPSTILITGGQRPRTVERLRGRTIERER